MTKKDWLIETVDKERDGKELKEVLALLTFKVPLVNSGYRYNWQKIKKYIAQSKIKKFPYESQSKKLTGISFLPYLAASFMLLGFLVVLLFGYYTKNKRLQTLNKEVASLKKWVEILDSESKSVRSYLNMVTSVGTVVAVFHDTRFRDKVKGAIFIDPSRKAYYLKLEDLDPCPPNKRYRVWFVSKVGKETFYLPCIHFSTTNSGKLEFLIERKIPENLEAVIVTLEDSVQDSYTPSGEIVLKADNFKKIS